MSIFLLGEILVTIRCLTESEVAALALITGPTGDVARNHHALAGLQIPGLGSILDHFRHEFITSHVARPYGRDEPVVHVEIGPRERS
jgi:hypothetical protein